MFSERIMVDDPSAGVCGLSCCSPHAFRKTAAVSDELATAKAACCIVSQCAMACPAVRAACVKGQCTLVSAVVGADAGAFDAATDAGTDGS